MELEAMTLATSTEIQALSEPYNHCLFNAVADMELNYSKTSEKTYMFSSFTKWCYVRFKNDMVIRNQGGKDDDDVFVCWDTAGNILAILCEHHRIARFAKPIQ